MKHLIEKTMAEQVIYEGKIIDLKLQEVRLPNGKTSKREIVKHPGAVAVIACTDEGRLILVRQYRKPMDRVMVEIPAGKLEPGEEPLVTAKRELEEETGYIADSLEKIISFYTSPGFADELVHLYEAKGLKKGDGTAVLDADEFVDVMEVTLQEAGQLIENHEIYDAKTAYAVQYLQLKEAAERK
ncbi:NUDIX domain-containing protein [Bacillus marinisedimentorum]|uniref:NUDIX domain-containing protein n=1 Tax=Bacillus marinisedimentorum TaxID=1821260 RepID=UPI000872ACF0|nr:NUDIX hydrolase [Bacillus marinisedimentorum]